MPDAASTVHAGHRDRMRKKFLRLGASAFDSYELLEMLLYTVVPYRDTNPIAHRLMNRFGTLSGVFSASAEELAEVEGIGSQTADFLLSFGEFADDSLLMADDSLCFDDYGTAESYFISYFRGKTESETVMVMLDNKMCFLGFEKIADLDFSSSVLQPKSFLEKILLNGASVVMVAHNHPHGPLFPTESDRAAQTSLKNAMDSAGVAFAEHFLVSGEHALGLVSRCGSLRQYPGLRRFYKSAEGREGGTP